ncbi:hypothetical protein ACYOEI_28065, partial [Singulisphaera rosea]
MADPSNLFISYVNTAIVSISGGASLAIDEVTDIDFDVSGEEEEWMADGSLFPKLVVAQRQRRRVKVSGGDVRKLLSLPWNTPSTFTTTLRDAVNGTSSGALNFTLTPCVVIGAPTKGSTGKFATGEVNLTAWAPDGMTDPLS